MRVLLTGATGFIGSHLLRLLARAGCEVAAVIRPGADTRRIADLDGRYRPVRAGMEDAAAIAADLDGWKPDLALHFAWYTVPGKYFSAPENVACVTASLDLVRWLSETGCPRIVAAGTCFEYDLDQGYLPESAPARPRGLYGAAKHAFYLMAREYLRGAGCGFAWPRIFYLYGPWEDERRLVPTVIRNFLRGQPCPLTTAEPVRDFLHVEDVAAAVWAIARSDVEGAVNVGSGKPVGIHDLARQAARLVGREDLLRPGALPDPAGEPPLICAGARRLMGLGWSPKYELEAGLKDTIEWWKQRLNGS